MYHGLEPYLLDHPLLLSLIWMALYTSDYYLTLVGARLHKKQDYYKIEGSYELTPEYQEDIDKGNRFSPRFLTLLLTIATAMYVIPLYLGAPKCSVGIIAGCFIILELPVHIRHIENIKLYRRLSSRNPGTTGQIIVTKESSYKRSATQMLCYAGLVFALYLLTGSWMLLGGTLALLSTARAHNALAKKCAKAAIAAKKNAEDQAEVKENV